MSRYQFYGQIRSRKTTVSPMMNRGKQKPLRNGLLQPESGDEQPH
jgi:hypothetical protein